MLLRTASEPLRRAFPPRLAAKPDFRLRDQALAGHGEHPAVAARSGGAPASGMPHGGAPEWQLVPIPGEIIPEKGQ